ncbi:MAG: SAM-dependent methyltransferase [Salinarchaeum sp.]
MTDRDEYYNRAKQEGYRARSAYKLKQLDETTGLFGPGNIVVDLGAAPGGWLQVAAEAVGDDGVVIGVDRQRIDPIEDVPARVETLRGDITEAETHGAIRERATALGGTDDGPGGPVDVVLSDLAPNMTGEYDLDHARSVHLARQAADVARAVLATGGDFAVKVFQGRDLEALESDLAADFEYVRRVVPEASREASSELYLVCKGFLTAPIRPGEKMTVKITDVGSEGDGVADVDGYTLFVPDTEAGETVTVRVEECKPRYGFAERID